MTDLEREVLDIINETIEGQYIGKFKVLQDNNSFSLFLYFDRELTPTVLAYEGTEEEFKNFIHEEFKTRKMEKTKFWKTIRVPITEDVLEHNVNTDWDNGQ